jgi:TRAP-type mannitol/chloroaromatic compound transport system substrate-binding protein
MNICTTLSALVVAIGGTLFAHPAIADVTIPYNEYSDSPTIGRGAGASTDPQNADFGAMRIFIQKVMDYTDENGPDALPGGQKVIFQRSQTTGREVSALRPGIQFANANAPKPLFSEPSWGFAYNSVQFGMRFEQMMGFLYDAKIEGFNGNGLALAQSILDSRGGTQIVLPVVGSTMQGSGYFPKPIGKPDCIAGDAECLSHGNGIGLAGLCTSGWRIRYLAPPQDIVDRSCDLLVKRGVISARTLTFYPPVGGQSVLLPMQRGTIQGFEYVSPYDDFADLFPVKEATATAPLGNPDAGSLDCSPALAYPIQPGTKPNCSQNIGQIGARYAHHPSWHQPFLMAWIHINKAVWNSLNAAQQAAIIRAAKYSVIESYNAAESVQCAKLKAILDINKSINQRNIDGTLRLVDGTPVSAAMTLATWPDDALKVLLEARDEHLASLAGPNNPVKKSDAQKDFTVISRALTQYMASIGAIKFNPGNFPARTGLVAGQQCNLVKRP